jgi:glucosamine-6-phosphate deaminase
MNIHRYDSANELARAAAAGVAAYLRGVIEQRGEARIVVATGASQLVFLEYLVTQPLDWSRITVFHLDEYVDLPPDHPAGFRRYLEERLISKVHPGTWAYIDGQAEPGAECRRIGTLISAAPIDAAFVGIGENAHLAFNDPPADVESDEPFLIVALDEDCRRQQFGEGWFPTLDDVPRRAISMSMRQILRARKIYCIVPEARKAQAVRASLEGEISPMIPASYLRTHDDVELYLDRDSAALLTEP